MKKGILILNIMMVLCIIALAYNLNIQWEAWQQSHNRKALLSQVDLTAKPVKVPEVDLSKVPHTDNDVSYIGDHNLFSKDRNLDLPEPKQQDQKAATPPKLQNPPVVDGLISIDGKRSVQVRPTRSTGSDRGVRLLSVGDQWFDNWTLKQIKDDRIVLAHGDNTEEVLIHDPNAKRNPAPRTTASKSRRRPVPGGKSNNSILTIGGNGTKTASTINRRTPVRSPRQAKPPVRRSTSNLQRNRSNRTNTRRSGLTSGRNLFRSRANGNRMNNNRNTTTSRRTNPFRRTNSSNQLNRR